MTKYIEMESLIELAQHNSPICQCMADFTDVKRLIEDAPSADVAPVVHGRWIVAHGNPTPYCSKCRKEAIRTFLGGYAYSEHCPRCGAKMQGKEATDGD